MRWPWLRPVPWCFCPSLGHWGSVGNMAEDATLRPILLRSGHARRIVPGIKRSPSAHPKAMSGADGAESGEMPHRASTVRPLALRPDSPQTGSGVAIPARQIATHLFLVHLLRLTTTPVMRLQDTWKIG